jgi:FtsH-binding integral membrane protein
MGFSYATALPVRTGVERATLIRRTYGLVFLSVIVTMLGVAFTATQPNLQRAVIQHPIITFLAMFAPLFMVMRDPRTFPKNVILTFLFTFIEGISIAPFLFLAEARSPGIVGQAGILTLAAFGGLSLFAVMSRRDFSAWGSFFFIGLLVLFITQLLNAFIFHSTGVAIWIAAVGVLIFSGLLIFDTWRITRSGQFGPDDYALAAVTIYLDLLNMFVFILSLLGGGNRRN